MNKRTNAAIDAVAKYIKATSDFNAERSKGTSLLTKEVLRVSKPDTIYFVEYTVNIYPDETLTYTFSAAHCVGDELPRTAVNALETMKNFLINNRNEMQRNMRFGHVQGVRTEDLVEAFLEDVL